MLTLPNWCGLMGQDILKGQHPPTLDSSTKFLKERFLFTLFTTVQSLKHIHGTICFNFCLFLLVLNQALLPDTRYHCSLLQAVLTSITHCWYYWFPLEVLIFCPNPNNSVTRMNTLGVDVINLLEARIILEMGISEHDMRVSCIN